MNKFTVVIPTRERADTLYHTLRTCVDQDYENFSILVSDNCSTDNTEEVVKSFKDKRVQYIRTPKRLSMSANWDFALDHVTEEGFVNFIGDDDGLIPGALEKVNTILAEKAVDAITSKDRAIYFWPKYLEVATQGNFLLSLKPTYRVLDTQHFFEESLKQCACVELPQLYHGFVRTGLVKELKRKHGNFFNGSSPDIYASIVLGKVLKRHIFSDYPITIHGLSQHSIGSSNSFKHIDANASQKFWVENNIPVHEKLEKSASMTIIYADAFLLARNFLPEIPELDIRNVLRLALNEPVTDRNNSNRDNLKEVIKRIAHKNNLESYANELIAGLPENVSLPGPVVYGLNPINEMLIMKTTEFGIHNIYDAFMLSKNLLHGKVYDYYSRPLNEGLVNYFRRGINSAVKKIFKR